MSPVVPFVLNEWHQWQSAKDVEEYMEMVEEFDEPYLLALIKRAPVNHHKSERIPAAPSFVFVQQLIGEYSFPDKIFLFTEKKRFSAYSDNYRFLPDRRLYRPPSV